MNMEEGVVNWGDDCSVESGIFHFLENIYKPSSKIHAAPSTVEKNYMTKVVNSHYFTTTMTKSNHFYWSTEE